MTMRMNMSMSVHWVHSFQEAQQLLKPNLVSAQAQAKLILHSLQSSREGKKEEKKENKEEKEEKEEKKKE